MSSARAVAWRRLCDETTTPKFWSLYCCWIHQDARAKGAATLHQRGQTITLYGEKVEALSFVFLDNANTSDKGIEGH